MLCAKPRVECIYYTLYILCTKQKVYAYMCIYVRTYVTVPAYTSTVQSSLKAKAIYT